MSPSTMPMHTFDADLLPSVDGLTPPSVEDRAYPVVDDDDKVCRSMKASEIAPSYVDNDIDTYRLLNINLLTLDVDNQTLRITHADGSTVDLPLGSIELHAPVRTEQFGKWGEIIYPIDDGGKVLLDKTNTPNLAAIHQWYYDEAKRVNDERLEIAEVVHAFADDIGHLANALE